MSNIGDVRRELASELSRVLAAHLPQTKQYAREVEIREDDRKKRSDASAGSRHWERYVFGSAVRLTSRVPPISAAPAPHLGNRALLLPSPTGRRQ